MYQSYNYLGDRQIDQLTSILPRCILRVQNPLIEGVFLTVQIVGSVRRILEA